MPATVRTTKALDGTAQGIAGVTSTPSPSGSGNDLGSVTEQDTLPRLASWLAEVSAEAALNEPSEAAAS
jgi:hypothetical protein